MKRLRREEGLGQSTWDPDIMKGPKGGSSRRKSRGSETGRRKTRSSDAATQRRDGFAWQGGYQHQLRGAVVDQQAAKPQRACLLQV